MERSLCMWTVVLLMMGLTLLNVLIYLGQPVICSITLISGNVSIQDSAPVQSQANVFYPSNYTSQDSSVHPHATTGSNSFRFVAIITLVNSSTLPLARRLVGSANAHAPGLVTLVFGYDLRKEQVSEVGIWTDAMLRNDTVSNPEEALSTVSGTVQVPIYVHPALQLRGPGSIESMLEMIDVDGCIRVRFKTGETAVMGGKYYDPKCRSSTEGISGALMEGDESGTCNLRHVYRLPERARSHGITTDQRPRICIGIPTIGLPGVSMLNLPILATVLTSLWETIQPNETSKFWYSLYMGYDEGDVTFDSQEGMIAFRDEVSRRSAGYAFDLVTVRFPPMAQDPVYIWNHLFRQAYLDGCEYLFQLVDDITLRTKGWSEAYARSLAGHSPPNYGVVGFQVSGTLISQPFVHRTHLDIFDTFYPRVFHNWYGDTWLSDIYTDTKGKTALQQYHLVNTQIYGQKYMACAYGARFAQEVVDAKMKLRQWLSSRGE